jgi:hypothetical protein
MKKEFVSSVVAAVALAGVALSPHAAAAKGPAAAGAVAPKTVLKSVIGGKVETYDLQAAASKRPVVLYFFPQAFSSG